MKNSDQVDIYSGVMQIFGGIKMEKRILIWRVEKFTINIPYGNFILLNVVIFLLNGDENGLHMQY